MGQQQQQQHGNEKGRKGGGNQRIQDMTGELTAYLDIEISEEILHNDSTFT